MTSTIAQKFSSRRWISSGERKILKKIYTLPNITKNKTRNKNNQRRYIHNLPQKLSHLGNTILWWLMQPCFHFVINLSMSSLTRMYFKGCLDAFLSTGQEEVGENENLRKFLSELYRLLRKPANSGDPVNGTSSKNPSTESRKKSRDKEDKQKETERQARLIIVSGNDRFLTESYFLEFDWKIDFHTFSNSFAPSSNAGGSSSSKRGLLFLYILTPYKEEREEN
eukprot:TRINITY_DN1967_c0_g1_i1.p1 TRINITY_DN1967_c0_g1~~TRINITY_DN1967_c0_g1_i1.p1  ORF type:complete len:224 (-),score=34.00 TRINITY_DN1967_c0_g1_i1:537-1208(-)